MLIVWGTKVVRRKIGRMADYCPMCRSARGFEVREIQSVGHLYYIPIGSRTTHGHTKACESCGLKFDLADGDMEAVVAEPRATTDQLIGWSGPAVSDRIARRTDLDRRARSGGLDPETRKHLILESFLVAEPLVSQRTAAIHLDAFSAAALLVTVAIPFVAMATVPGASLAEPPGLVVFLTLLGLAALSVIVSFATDGRRYTRRKLLPMIARSLAPLKPSRAELDGAFEVLREAKVKIGKYLDAHRVEDAVRDADLFSDPTLS